MKLKSVLFYFPDVEDDSFEVGREFWFADEKCVVEPGVFAVVAPCCDGDEKEK